MASLINAFDFDNPDYSIPTLPEMKEPHVNSAGDYDGAAYCTSQYNTTRPPVPYTGEGAVTNVSSLVEKGFKQVRGMLTEGRFLVLEMNGSALTNPSSCAKSGANSVRLTRARPEHDRTIQRWVIHAVEIGGDEFTFSSAVDGQYICADGELCTEADDATVFVVGFEPGKGHSFQVQGSESCTCDFLVVDAEGNLSFQGEEDFWQVFSVTG